MSRSEKLNNLRKKIDKIDEEILTLLNRRAQVAIEISKFKVENSFVVYDPAREIEIERRITELNPGPFPQNSVLSVFREIISGCRSLEKPTKVAYLGPEGTFTHQAVLREFGSSIELTAVKSVGEVFEEVEKGRASYGVVPIENSMEGSLGSVLDMFLTSDIKVIKEIFENISHFLLSKTGDMNDISVVASHPQALSQCRRWLSEHLGDKEIRETPSTARAAIMASEDESIAAIASEFAASIYGLRVIEERIEDSPRNLTRFWVMGKSVPLPTGFDKTSILFSFKDEPGALSRALVPFAEAGINLTKIESRPSKEKPWEYVFFVDFIGHSYNEEIKDVISKVERSCIFLKVLGSYPKGRGS